MPEGQGESSDLKDRTQVVDEVWGVHCSGFMYGVMALGWSLLTGHCVSCNI